jgi:Flavodoxin
METVLLDFPIWGMTAPPVIRSYLAAHEFAGRTLVPVITHGGYGVGQSLNVIARDAPKARLHDAFVMKADQERESLEQVSKWLSNVLTIRPRAEPANNQERNES